MDLLVFIITVVILFAGPLIEKKLKQAAQDADVANKDIDTQAPTDVFSDLMPDLNPDNEPVLETKFDYPVSPEYEVPQEEVFERDVVERDVFEHKVLEDKVLEEKEPVKPREKIDPKKLVIYSEIMNPKF